MSFDHGRLYRLTDDIERYLGYLKGNELVREYTFAQRDSSGEPLPLGVRDMSSVTVYTSTPQESELACDFAALMFWDPSLGIDQAPESREFFGEMAAGMEQSWNNGLEWAKEMGAELRAICAPFTRPEPARLQDIAKRLRSLSAGTLATLLPADFAAHSDGQNFGSTLDGWHGTAANSFQTFYDNLADRGNGYAVSVGLAAGWVAGTSGLIAAAQTGLLDFLESVRERLVIQLEAWVAQRGDPHDYEDSWIEALSDIGDIAQVVVEVAGLVPVVDKFRKVPGTIKDIAGLIGAVDTMTSKVDEYVGGGKVPEKTPRTELKVETAADLYAAVTTVLYDELLGELNKGLQDLAAKSRPGIAMLNDLKKDGDWLPHDVLPYDDGVDIFDTPWIHYTDL